MSSSKYCKTCGHEESHHRASILGGMICFGTRCSCDEFVPMSTPISVPKCRHMGGTDDCSASCMMIYGEKFTTTSTGTIAVDTTVPEEAKGLVAVPRVLLMRCTAALGLVETEDHAWVDGLMDDLSEAQRTNQLRHLSLSIGDRLELIGTNHSEGTQTHDVYAWPDARARVIYTIKDRD